MKISWSQLKDFLDSRQASAQFVEFDDKYWIKGIDGRFELECELFKNVSDTSELDDFESNYKSNGNLSPNNFVTTQEEKNDKVLKLSCGFADFVDGVAIISITVPAGGRWAAGGYCFSDVWTMGDRITKVQVTHPEMGVVKMYYDSEAAEPNRGWAMYPAQQNSGEIEIDPIGGYGFIPEGFVLEVHAECANATKLACDVWWGKNE